MVGAESYNQQLSYEAANDAGHCLADVGRWVSVSAATAALIGLSFFNAMHGPVYDCVRAGAYFLRSRRGPIVQVMQVEGSHRVSGARAVPALPAATNESFLVVTNARLFSSPHK